MRIHEHTNIIHLDYQTFVIYFQLNQLSNDHVSVDPEFDCE